MKNKFHPNLTSKKWQALSQEKQILNIAAEFSRAKNWLAKKQINEFLNCLNRAFELIDLSINDPSWRNKLNELLRLREILAKFYWQKNKNIKEFIKIFKALLFLNKVSAQVII